MRILEPDEDGVILRLAPSAGRRIFAVATLYLLGALLVWMAVAQPPAPGWAALLVVMALAALVAGERLRRATALSLVLTQEGLGESGGRLLARWDDMVRVERGTFAFKPSNGFLIVLSSPGAPGWAPGLWWRVGRRIGVGGVTSRQAARFMAEQMALELAARDAAAD